MANQYDLDSGFEILPGMGLGPLRFGMSALEVESILGKAEQVETFEEGDIHLMYPGKGVFLFFGASDGDRLSGIEINNLCRCRLFGSNIFSKKRRQLVELLDSNVTTPARPIYLEADGGTRISRRSLSMDFYFDEKGSLLEINFGPIGSLQDW